MTTQSITSGQRKQIVRFGSDAIEAVLKSLVIDREGAQRVIKHGDEFASAIRDSTDAVLQNLSIRGEEVSSSYAYPEGYKVKGIAEQVAILRQLFPRSKYATFDESIATRPLPNGAEGWFAIPKWEEIDWPYCMALNKVLAAIAAKRTFYDWRQVHKGSKRLRQSERSIQAFKMLCDLQKGSDILIVPCQFGLRHRGRSVRRARDVMNENEFGLDSFAVGCMILTHPEREVQEEQLHVYCAGDESSHGAEDYFSRTPHFSFLIGKIGFDVYWDSEASKLFGSASGFLLAAA